MSQKLPVINFEWIEDTSQFNEDFMKDYNEEGDKRYFLEVGIQHLEKLHDFHNDIPFLPKRIKIEKVKKLAANLHDKTEYVIHMRNIKQALNHGLVLKKVHRAIIFNQNAWLKPYIHMNTDLRKNAKNDFEKVDELCRFEKTMKYVRKHRDNRIVTTERRRNYLVSEPNCYTRNLFTENLSAIEKKKTETLMNQPVYLGLSILQLSKILMHEF